MKIRVRSRVALPFVLVIVAAVLITSNLLRPDPFWSPAFTKPDRQICDALNAPATVAAKYPVDIAYRWLSPHYPLNLIVELIIYLSLVWLVWYVVSVEMGGKGLSVLTPKTGMRKVSDVLAIMFGAPLGAAGLAVASQLPGWYGRLVSTPYLFWALAVVAFYGHDLWACFRPTRRELAGKDHSS
jgi:hypothetical protein